MLTNIFDLYLLYNFVRRLTTPFTKWKAYELGVIDEHGNILIPKQNRTEEQRNSLRIYDVLIMNLKKMLAKLPGGGSRIATFGAALYLMREDVHPDISPEHFKEKLLEYMQIVERENLLNEDAPTNATGSSIAGLDTGVFAGAKVFTVDSDKMWKSRFGKKKYHRYAAYVGEDEVGEEIRQYARNNPKENIILKDSISGAMMFLRRPKPKG